MAHAGAKGSTALQLKQALGLTKLLEEEINSAIGDLIRSMKVYFIIVSSLPDFKA